MRRIAIPPLKFSRWHAWENRQNIAGCEYPGVYLVAITRRNLAGAAVEWKDVAYIGMTKSKGGLKARWSQFQNSIQGRDGHSGGWAIYNDLGNYAQWKQKLFVAAMSVKCDPREQAPTDLKRMGWVSYLEYEAFSLFCRRFPKIGKPRYNTQ